MDQGYIITTIKNSDTKKEEQASMTAATRTRKKPYQKPVVESISFLETAAIACCRTVLGNCPNHVKTSKARPKRDTS